jgi:hypothetical protein
MRESCTYGVVRGALSNERPYRDHHCLGRDAFASGPEILRRLFNCVRTHRSLNKDAAVSRPVQRAGVISSRVILGGLHHRYARV